MFDLYWLQQPLHPVVNRMSKNHVSHMKKKISTDDIRYLGDAGRGKKSSVFYRLLTIASWKTCIKWKPIYLLFSILSDHLSETNYALPLLWIENKGDALYLTLRNQMIFVSFLFFSLANNDVFTRFSFKNSVTYVMQRCVL